MKTPLLAATALATLGLAGCITADGRFVPPDPIGRALFGQPRVVNEYAYYESYEPREVVVAVPPPQPIYERRISTVPRGYRDPVYVDGHHYWTGNQWAWQSGRYIERPRSGVNWYRPTTYNRSGRVYYRSGYWR